MTQLFFISPTLDAAKQALDGLVSHPSQWHAWQDLDAGGTQVIGVVNMGENCDTEAVATSLETAGVLVLPDHRFNGQVGKSITDALAAYGVNASDTTATALAKVHGKSGFPDHKPKRFS